MSNNAYFEVTPSASSDGETTPKAEQPFGYDGSSDERPKEQSEQTPQTRPPTTLGMEPLPAPTDPPASLSPPGVHAGPADGSSIPSSYPTPEMTAAALLPRGPPPPRESPHPLARQPEQLGPEDLPVQLPENTRRLINNACYHAALVCIRLTAADREERAADFQMAARGLWEEEFNAMFQYLMQHEANLPPEAEEWRFQCAQADDGHMGESEDSDV